MYQPTVIHSTTVHGIILKGKYRGKWLRSLVEAWFTSPSSGRLCGQVTDSPVGGGTLDPKQQRPEEMTLGEKLVFGGMHHATFGLFQNV